MYAVQEEQAGRVKWGTLMVDQAPEVLWSRLTGSWSVRQKVGWQVTGRLFTNEITWLSDFVCGSLVVVGWIILPITAPSPHRHRRTYGTGLSDQNGFAVVSTFYDSALDKILYG